MRRYSRKKRGKILLYIAFTFAVLVLVALGGTSLVFSEISKNIDKNGLLLGSNTGYAQVMAVEEQQRGDSSWYEPGYASNISVKTSDGFMLTGISYEHKPKSCGWALIVHGYSSRKEDMLTYAKRYYNEGYNVLLPDLRAHGESEGDFVGMGWLDRKDLVIWIENLLVGHPDADIVMHGISMGGAAVMMASGEELPGNVKAIVEDSGYTSVWDILDYQLGYRYHLPAFPVLYGASIWSNSKWGYNWKEASAVEQVKKSKTPILFIHGGEDDIVPTTMAYDVYQAAKCKKRLLIIEGAEHAGAVCTNPERYWDEVFSFIDSQ
jgi:fermentation-respiration switch protein FrsA (DUF1100 family)